MIDLTNDEVQKINEESKINAAEVHMRRIVWEEAAALVAPIVEQHGIKPYPLGNIFVPSSTVTSVEQHIEQIERVADWLLNQEGRLC